MYLHPAYSIINFTVITSQDRHHHSSLYPKEAHSSNSPSLCGLPSPTRAFSYALELHHVADTQFSSEVLFPHGMGEEVVWQHVNTTRAVFEFGLTGEEVERLGIELSEEMAEAAKRKGAKFWKEGMIWFEKI